MGKSNSTKLNPRAKDETGKVYGKLTVVGFAHLNREVYWLCQCECGNTVAARGSHLRTGGATTCGCVHYKVGGDSKSPEYGAWKYMKQRCYNPNIAASHCYSERGIVVCARWKHSYLAFLADMGRKPFPEASTERLDNDGNYSCGQCEECRQNGWPANCKWATKMEQSHNSRRVRLLTYKGETMCASEWARKLGIGTSTLNNRLKRGWPEDKIFSSEKHHYRSTTKRTKP